MSCSTYTTFYGTVAYDATDASLKRFDLSYQNLKTSPDLSEITDLRMLDLSGNPDLDIVQTLQTISAPERLQVLRLDSLNLKQLPDLDRFKNLKQLSLIHNPDLPWDTVFTTIAPLPLEFLNLKGNALQQLPQSISLLKSIKDLNLSYNHIVDEATYTYLKQLPLLYNLWLDHNAFGVLPEGVGQLDQVVYFYIDHNELQSLPDAMLGMKNLTVLHAGHNNFEELPVQFIQMESLFMVHANTNKITHIPELYFTEKCRLLALILDNNPLPEAQVKRVKKHFSNFFLLSFEQKNYGYR